jgi:hypothetical protein
MRLSAMEVVVVISKKIASGLGQSGVYRSPHHRVTRISIKRV